ncbi:MAG: hypothetical protein SNF33_07810 [Candidatus Algichlamydia australiensis]|nr:hypothetical protein [Chlamydiales bacterium]
MIHITNFIGNPELREAFGEIQQNSYQPTTPRVEEMKKSALQPKNIHPPVRRIAKKASSSHTQKNIDRVLRKAIRSGDLSTLKKEFSEVPTSKRGEAVQTSYKIAVSQGKAKVAAYLLNEEAANPSEISLSKLTALRIAAEEAYLKI